MFWWRDHDVALLWVVVGGVLALMLPPVLQVVYVAVAFRCLVGDEMCQLSADYGRLSIADQVSIQYRIDLSKRQIFDETVRSILCLPAEVDDATVLVELSTIKHAADLWRAHQRKR